MIDNRPLTPETAKEVESYLDSTGYFEDIMRLAFPERYSDKVNVAASLQINSSAGISDEEDEDVIYDSDTMKEWEYQHDLTAKVKSFLTSMAEDIDSGFNKLREDGLVSMIQEKFPDCFWARDLVKEYVPSLRKRNRELRIAHTHENSTAQNSGQQVT